ncbi:hypothetical protein K9L05_00755 [Candidatus Babeliales bacterium]|nr:hypothetical protein [Candidatus Babeliales bacterium]
MLGNYIKLTKNIKIKFLAILLALFYVSLIFVWEYNKRIYPEKIAPINQITDNIKKISTRVSTGLFINNFLEFSFAKNNFLIDAYVWFKYPANKNLIEDLEKFSFKESEIIYKSPASIEKINDKDELAIFKVKVSLKFPDINHKNYPIGDHRLNIILENNYVTYDKFYFSTDDNNFEISKQIYIPKWKPIKTSAQAGFLDAKLNFDKETITINYPCALFNINLKNINIRETITLYLAMLGIFLIILLTLLLPLDPYANRISAITASIPILVLFRTVILQLSPAAGEFNKADFLYFLLVFCSIIVLFFHVYFYNIKKHNDFNKEKNNKLKSLEKFNDVVLYFILILFIMAITYDAIIT